MLTISQTCYLHSFYPYLIKSLYIVQCRIFPFTCFPYNYRTRMLIQSSWHMSKSYNRQIVRDTFFWRRLCSFTGACCRGSWCIPVCGEESHKRKFFSMVVVIVISLIVVTKKKNLTKASYQRRRLFSFTGQGQMLQYGVEVGRRKLAILNLCLGRKEQWTPVLSSVISFFSAEDPSPWNGSTEFWLDLKYSQRFVFPVI